MPPRYGSVRRHGASTTCRRIGRSFSSWPACDRSENHDLAFRVAARLIHDPARPLVVMVGSRTDTADMRSRVEAAGLSDTVRLLGHSSEVASLLAAGDIALLTSRTEGLPNALLEAGVAGLPSVSTDCGGAGEVLVDGETGYIVGVNDDKAMAVRLSELAADPALRRHMGEAARRRVTERHAPERVAAIALAAYRDACARAGRRVQRPDATDAEP